MCSTAQHSIARVATTAALAHTPLSGGNVIAKPTPAPSLPVPTLQGGMVGVLVPASAAAAGAGGEAGDAGGAYGGVFIGDIRLSGVCRALFLPTKGAICGQRLFCSELCCAALSQRVRCAAATLTHPTSPSLPLISRRAEKGAGGGGHRLRVPRRRAVLCGGRGGAAPGRGGRQRAAGGGAAERGLLSDPGRGVWAVPHLLRRMLCICCAYAVPVVPATMARYCASFMDAAAVRAHRLGPQVNMG